MLRIFLIYSFVTIINNGQLLDKENLKNEIFEVEKRFEKMAADSGIAKAFYFFADDSAVIKRQNDTIIYGKENIRNFYSSINDEVVNVTWTPDFVDVSESGDMAYTYGKYLWEIKSESGEVKEYRGIFHTIWKKNKNNEWKYVWD